LLFIRVWASRFVAAFGGFLASRCSLQPRLHAFGISAARPLPSLSRRASASRPSRPCTYKENANFPLKYRFFRRFFSQKNTKAKKI
jgi:hypothetical protein